MGDLKPDENIAISLEKTMATDVWLKIRSQEDELMHSMSVHYIKPRKAVVKEAEPTWII